MTSLSDAAFDAVGQLGICVIRANGIAMAGIGSERTGSVGDGEAVQQLAYDLKDALQDILNKLDASRLQSGPTAKPVPTVKPEPIKPLFDLEPSIFDAVRQMDALMLLMEAQLVPFRKSPDDGEYCRLEAWEYEALLFVAGHARELVDNVQERWREAVERQKSS